MFQLFRFSLTTMLKKPPLSKKYLYKRDRLGKSTWRKMWLVATEGEEKEHFIWRQRRPLVCLRQCDWRRIERRISRKFFRRTRVGGGPIWTSGFASTLNPKDSPSTLIQKLLLARTNHNMVQHYAQNQTFLYRYIALFFTR